MDSENILVIFEHSKKRSFSYFDELGIGYVQLG